MTVAYLFGSLNRGGTETLMLDVFRSVSADKFEVIGIYRKEGVLRTEFEASGAMMLHLPIRRNPLHYLYSLRRLVKQHQIHIIHAVQSLDAVLASIACAALKVKVVQTIHGFDLNSPFATKMLIGLSIRLTSANVYVSKFQREYYLRTYNRPFTKKEIVVYNGIDMDKFIPRYGKPISSDIQILSVGNFNAVRDQLTLCKFALRLKKEGVNFKWLFAGKQVEDEAWRYGQCVEFVQQHNLTQQVVFLGSRSDIPQLLAKADIFIYASEHDTFGIAVVEALAAGVPVLVNDWLVMKEITEEGKLACIYKTKDEDDFYRQFRHLITTTSSTQQAATAQKTSKLFSIQEHINQLIQSVYQPLLHP